MLWFKTEWLYTGVIVKLHFLVEVSQDQMGSRAVFPPVFLESCAGTVCRLPLAEGLIIMITYSKRSILCTALVDFVLTG